MTLVFTRDEVFIEIYYLYILYLSFITTMSLSNSIFTHPTSPKQSSAIFIFLTKLFGKLNNAEW